jgi:hypothetical protein
MEDLDADDVAILNWPLKKEVLREYIDWIYLAQFGDKRWDLVNMTMKIRIS